MHDIMAPHSDEICHNELSSHELSQITKPHAAIENLIKTLSPHAEKIMLSPGDLYILSYPNTEPKILLLTSGVARFYAKRVNSTNNAILFNMFFSPSICGLIGGYADHYDLKYIPYHYVVAEVDCTAYILSADAFSSLVEKYNFWHDVSHILACRLLVFTAKKVESVGSNTYRKIRYLLSELWAYPEEVREKINVLTFIRSHTLISRSQIMKILSELKSGDYIKIIKGRLIHLKRLPKYY